MQFSMRPKTQPALLTASACCCLMQSLLAPATPGPSLWAALQPLSSHLCLCLALFCPRCRARHFPLLTFMLWLIAQCSNLSRSLDVAVELVTVRWPSSTVATSQLGSLTEAAEVFCRHKQPFHFLCGLSAVCMAQHRTVWDTSKPGREFTNVAILPSVPEII